MMTDENDSQWMDHPDREGFAGLIARLLPTSPEGEFIQTIRFPISDEDWITIQNLIEQGE